MTTSDLQVQIFGTKKSVDTRKALRFFNERRIQAQFVDLTKRAAAPGELKRFVQKFGIDALIDRQSKRFGKLCLEHAQLTESRWLEKLLEEPMLLKMPLVRCGQRLTVGLVEDEWRRWVGS